MSNILPIPATIETLHALRQVVRTFSERERTITNEFQSWTLNERKSFRTAVETLQNELAEVDTQTTASLQSEKEQAALHHRNRAARIVKAFHSARQQSLAAVEQDIARRRYDLQKSLLGPNNSLPQRRKEAEDLHAAFTTLLATECDTLLAVTNQAARLFSAYPRLLNLNTDSGATIPELAETADAQLQQLRTLIQETRELLDTFATRPVQWLVRHLPPIVLVPCAFIAHVAALPFLLRFGLAFPAASLAAGSSLAAFTLGVTTFYFIARSGAKASASAVARSLEKARTFYNECLAAAETRLEARLEQAEADHSRTAETFEQEWHLLAQKTTLFQEMAERRIDKKKIRALTTNDEAYRIRISAIEKKHALHLEQVRTELQSRIAQLNTTHEQATATRTARDQSNWNTLQADWRAQIQAPHLSLGAARTQAETWFPPWNPDRWQNWSFPTAFAHAAQFGHLDVNLAEFCENLPQDPRLALPGSTRFQQPLALTLPNQGSILLNTRQTGREDAILTLNNLIIRLLTVSPPGKLKFVLLDPVGLGQSFASIMHLADYEESLVSSRIWTQPRQIEQRLEELNEHMEKVIQMYLRNEYATLTEYNEQAGDIAEKYHFLVVADFPTNFSEVAARQLLSIVTSGARCGVYTLIHWDNRRALPQDFVPDELAACPVRLTAKGDKFCINDKFIPGAPVVLERPPDPAFTTELLHKIGRGSRDANHVEVPFSHVAPAPSQFWSGDCSSQIRVPIGRTGATKLQFMDLGKGTLQHAVIAGKTGSGKSTLFHVLITNLSLWYSPDQLEFYLIDFKKGVEFKCYATSKLPHARVIAIESDRNFGLSVLQKVDDELKRRGELFRKAGVQDLPAYRASPHAETIPRTLVLIDEFQEFFVEDDNSSRNAALLLDRLVRQGRAFGIHIILGSQTLGGAYTLSRTTLGQMVIRIALQCNEADAYLIMDDDNAAPRMLTRPGEALYNDDAGRLEGNSPFQIVWLADDTRESALQRIRNAATTHQPPYPVPVVFEGNAPADVAENALLAALLAQKPAAPPLAARIWLGAPCTIKPPTDALFRRQSADNLLIVGQNSDAILAILGLALVTLAAQYPAGAVRFFLLDGTPADWPGRRFLDEILANLHQSATRVLPADIQSTLAQIKADITRKRDDIHDPAIPTTTFVFIYEVQTQRKLRYEDDFGLSDDTDVKPGALLKDIILEGSSVNTHVIASCDTLNNVTRALGRNALSEFAMRIAFQMSPNDSAGLIDSPDAGNLGLYRALLYNEHEGSLETFRPYAMPDPAWLATRITKPR